MAGLDAKPDHRPMDPLHLEVLDANHEKLVASMKATAVIDRLYREEVITKYDYDQLRRTEAQGPKAMNRLLILTLRRRGGNAYPSLVRAMRASGQDKLCDVLFDLEVSIKEGMDTARFERQYGHLNGSMDLNGLEDLTPRRPIRSPMSPPGVGTKDKGNSLWSPSPAPETTGSRDQSPVTRDPASRASTSRPPGDRDQEVQKLQKELEEVKQSRSQMEQDLKQKIQQLEKEKEDSKNQPGDKESAKKKDGGCSVM